MDSEKKSIMIGTIFVAVLVLAGVIVGGALVSAEKVEAGEVKVCYSSPFGNTGKTYDVGWNCEPANLFDKYDSVNIRTQTIEYVGSDSAEDTTGGITVKTSEGLDTNIDMAITFHVDKSKAGSMRLQYGSDWQSTLIEQPMRSIPRTIGATYTVEDIYGDKRVEFESKILTAITEKIAESGIVVEDVTIREVRLPDTVMDKINAKISAEQEKLKADIDKQTKIINAEAEKEVQKNQADANAYTIQKEAEADALAITTRADADAEAYRAKVLSYINDPDNYTQEEWDNAVNAYLTWLKYNDANVIVTDGSTVVVTP